MIDVIPSILVKTKEEFFNQLNSLEHTVNHVQLDIADGTFVPNTTWGEPEAIQQVEDYTFELHLMVASPLEVIAEWSTTSSVVRFIIHLESMKNISETIANAREYNQEIFVALNPKTPLSQIELIKDTIDGILFMGVVPGFQGQKLIPNVLKKIRECREKYPDLYTELDGGVHEDTLEAITKSGVHAICPGSMVFKRDIAAAEQVMTIKKQLTKIDN